MGLSENDFKFEDNEYKLIYYPMSLLQNSKKHRGLVAKTARKGKELAHKW